MNGSIRAAANLTLCIAISHEGSSSPDEPVSYAGLGVLKVPDASQFPPARRTGRKNATLRLCQTQIRDDFDALRRHQAHAIAELKSGTVQFWGCRRRLWPAGFVIKADWPRFRRGGYSLRVRHCASTP